MNNITLISYFSSNTGNLLSLREKRSKYMLPLAGSYRIVDFVLRSASLIEAKNTLIFSNVKDELPKYIKNHPLNPDENEDRKIEVFQSNNILLNDIANKIKENESKIYIFYNGDNPGLINFKKIVQNYVSKKKPTVRYKLKIGQKATMSNNILVTNKNSLLKVLKIAKKEKRETPNMFEMIQNMLILNKVSEASYSATFWNLANVVDYFNINFKLCRDHDLFNILYNDPVLKSGITPDQPSQIGSSAAISNSFISEGCIINGRVENSIVFPGVIVAEKSIIRDSILLPFVAIDKSCYIENSIIDEFSNYDESSVLFNISEKCRIGSDKSNLKNRDFAKALLKGISLIGRNTILPQGSSIGGACYIAPFKNKDNHEGSFNLENGHSII